MLLDGSTSWMSSVCSVSRSLSGSFLFDGLWAAEVVPAGIRDFTGVLRSSCSDSWADKSDFPELNLSEVGEPEAVEDSLSVIMTKEVADILVDNFCKGSWCLDFEDFDKFAHMCEFLIAPNSARSALIGHSNVMS